MQACLIQTFSDVALSSSFQKPTTFAWDKACTCRSYGQITAVNTEQQTIHACFANGTQDQSYQLSELASLQQSKKLEWVTAADIIVSSLDAMIKYGLKSG